MLFFFHGKKGSQSTFNSTFVPVDKTSSSEETDWQEPHVLP